MESGSARKLYGKLFKRVKNVDRRVQINTQYKPSCRSTFILRKHKVYDYARLKFLKSWKRNARKENRRHSKQKCAKRLERSRIREFPCGWKSAKVPNCTVVSPRWSSEDLPPEFVFIGRFSEKMLRSSRPSGLLQAFPSTTAGDSEVICPRPGRRKDFG